MDYIKNQSANGLAKVFKAGNSEAIRLSKKDTNIFKVKPGDQVIKEISPDGSSIRFRKIPIISDKTKQAFADILDEDQDLIQALKDL